MANTGEGAVFKLDDSNDSLTDISSDLTDIGIDGISGRSFESQTFGDSWVERVMGLKDGGTITLTGEFAATINTHLFNVVGSEDLDWEYGPLDATSGNPKFTGKAQLQNYSLSTPVDGKISFTATLEVDGAVTLGTYA